MKFIPDVTRNMTEIGELNIGDTFIDVKNFNEEEVLMIIRTDGYDCHVEFEDGVSEIAVVSLTSGKLWSYTRDEDVIPIETDKIKYRIS